MYKKGLTDGLTDTLKGWLLWIKRGLNINDKDIYNDETKASTSTTKC